MFIKGSKGTFNILDWSSQKMSIPITSPLAGECEAALEAYSRVKWIRSLIMDMSGITDMKATIMSDSKSLISSINNSAQVRDKRSMICVATLRAVYEHDGVAIVWTPGYDNLADHLTKTTTNARIVRQMLKSGILVSREQPDLTRQSGSQ